MAMSALLLKALRGGRSGASASSLQAIGRLAPQDGGGGVAPLLPRFGSTVPLRRGLGTTPPLIPRAGLGASPASPTAPAAGMLRRLLHKGQGFFSRLRGFSSQGQEHPAPRALLTELRKQYVWTGVSFETWDSKGILLFLGEKADELDYYIECCKRHWKYPALAFAVGFWFMLSFLVQLAKHRKNKKALNDLDLLIQKTEKETELAKAELEVVMDKLKSLGY